MKRILLAATLCVVSAPALADEGMWTYDNFPAAKVKEKYKFAPDQKWLSRVQLGSARLARGCSGSFVSKEGLVLTNHHCAQRCIEQLSTGEKDLIKNGFYAKDGKDELRCPNTEINQLVSITDVTARITKATEGLSGQAYNDRQKAEMAAAEKECAKSDAERCDVVTLYNGGQYHLYQYKRFQHVRLVWAPEFAMAFFGGDPDNFMFPRYDLDMTLLRVYEKEKPARMDVFLPWNAQGAKEGELTFVSGHPWRTSRLLTVAELEYQRDVSTPWFLGFARELRGLVTMYQTRGDEQKRHSNGLLFGIENAIKGRQGRFEALLDPTLMRQKAAEEKTLRDAIAADDKKKAAYGAAHDEIAKAVTAQRALRKSYTMVEAAYGFRSDLFQHARTLLRLADETAKPDAERLREFNDSNLPSVKQGILSPAPIHNELETELLTWSLTKLREELSPDHAVVKKVLGLKSPRELATDCVNGSKLGDVKVREALMTGGKAALDASTDPMVALARLVDGDARAVRKQYEDTIESVIKKNSELLARARFEVQGTASYPDATATLRLSYGSVEGYVENGVRVNPLTTLGGAFDRATGKDPFALPQSWLDAKGTLDLATPFNMATSNDIIGGNSGSPVVNQKGEVVGLVFDGNIQSLGGEFGFDPAVNRTVAVHTAAISEALRKIYKTDRINKELNIPPAKAASGKK